MKTLLVISEKNCLTTNEDQYISDIPLLSDTSDLYVYYVILAADWTICKTIFFTNVDF